MRKVVKKIEPDSSQWYPAKGQEEMGANWNTGHKNRRKRSFFTVRVPKDILESSLNICKTWLQMAPSNLLWLTILWIAVGLYDFHRSFPTSMIMCFCVILEDLWKSLRWLCQVWQIAVFLLSLSCYSWSLEKRRLYMYTLILRWFDKCSQCFHRENMLTEVKDCCLHSILECSEERRLVILFEELNLIITPSPINYQWVENIASGHTAYQKESEVILSESRTHLYWNEMQITSFHPVLALSALVW